MLGLVKFINPDSGSINIEGIAYARGTHRGAVAFDVETCLWLIERGLADPVYLDDPRPTLPDIRVRMTEDWCDPNGYGGLKGDVVTMPNTVACRAIWSGTALPDED